jgi:hypothetical protein
MQPLSAMPFYYLDNFRVMLETLRARDADVLAPHELEFMDHFSRLEKCSRALLVRMIMRKGPAVSRGPTDLCRDWGYLRRHPAADRSGMGRRQTHPYVGGCVPLVRQG